MEAAHLTSAHDHVRSAATATYGSNLRLAGTEHELAASSFRDAAHDTDNPEALRILALLEGQHHKLAQLIKEPPTKIKEEQQRHNHDGSHVSESPVSSPPAKAPSARTASPSPLASPPRATSRRRLPQSSIASNLAEKRGIPGARRGTPVASSVSVTNALANRTERQETPVRDLLQRQARRAEDTGKGRDDSLRGSSGSTELPKTTAASPSHDDNFKRFYSAFGGVISAISAPLAFTSLPLNPTSTPSTEPTSPTQPKAKSPETSRVLKPDEPDITSLISKPALRALREDHGPSGPFANTESFYLVPTSGGTMSYANIVNNPQHHPLHAAQSPHLDAIDEREGDGLRGSSHEEFVDARETAYPPSPTAGRHQRPRSKGSLTTQRSLPAGRGGGMRTMEELQLENDTLRGLCDKQAKRLQMWEATSQSSYNALAQSFRARGGMKPQLSDPSALAHALSMGSGATPALPSPPPVPGIPEQYRAGTASNSPELRASRPPDPELAKRIADLEALLQSREQTITQLESQNEKNGKVIGRYREQWEKLKAGARKKEQERRERRLAEIKAGETAKDSESGENAEVEDKVEEGLEESAAFGKA